MAALILSDDKVNKHYSGSGYKTQTDSKLGKSVCGIKTRGSLFLEY
jgi:hypothetical protein